MPFSRSRSIESRTRSATSWFSRNEPDCHSIASTSVVLPWSTWATMATLRRSSRRAVGRVGTAAQRSRTTSLQPMADLPLTGGCLCGGVRFEIDEPLVSRELLPLHPLPAAHGHRRLGAGTDRTGVAPHREGRGARPLLRASGRVLEGVLHELRRRPLQPAPNAEDLSGVRLGALDGDPGIRPQHRQFVAYAAVWEPIPDDGLPRFPEGKTAWTAARRPGPAGTGRATSVRAVTEYPLTGGCLCGGVRFEIDEPLVSASYCHCTRCQRRTVRARRRRGHRAGLAPDPVRRGARAVVRPGRGRLRG